MSWRKHQKEVYQRAQKIRLAREVNTDTFTEVVPGGGKSKNVSILAHQLREAGMIKGIVWITPRLSLQSQAVDSALEGPGGPRNPKGFRIGPNVYSATGQGFATNFASLLRSPKEHLAALRKINGPVLLVADEIHFCRGGHELAGWGEAFAALRKDVFDAGGHQISMTGTARRWDNRPVINAPYDPLGKNHLDPSAMIYYDRSEGLEDEAITKIQPQVFDGLVQWRGPEGLGTKVPELISSFDDKRDKMLMGRSLSAFLSALNIHDVHTPVVWDALTRPRQGWLRNRNIYGNNQIIIMVDRQETAIALANILNSNDFRHRLSKKAKSQGVDFTHDFHALLAISGAPYAQSAIESFRHNRLTVDFPKHRGPGDRLIHAAGRKGQQAHCLITIGMASVGLDAPACTHLVALGTGRSIPWLTQAFARAWRAGRYDWPKGRPELPVKERMAYVWMPADHRMKVAFEAICTGSYAAGISNRQINESWHLIPDPAIDSQGLDGIGEKEKELIVKASKERAVYEPVPGACRVTDIKSYNPS